MNASASRSSRRAASHTALATAVLGSEGTILRWSRAATELLGRTSEEVCGHLVWELFADALAYPWGNVRRRSLFPGTGQARLRHRSGSTVEVVFHALALEGGEYVVLAAPSHLVADEGDAWSLGGLFRQGRIVVCVHDTDLNIARADATLRTFTGTPWPVGALRDILSPEEVEATEAALRQVLDTGVPLVGRPGRLRWPLPPGRRRTMSLSAFQLENASGHPTGVATVFTDISEQERIRRHLALRHAAAERIGASLDVNRTAQDLAEILVTSLGDLAWVVLADAVFEGDEPPKLVGGGRWHMRRAAVASASGTWPSRLLPPLAEYPPLPDGPIMQHLQRGKAVTGHRTEHPMFHIPELEPLFIPEHGHSFMSSPLYARGLVLGLVVVWRTEKPDAFDDVDSGVLTEIASRAALSVDNARRYTHERRAAIALQRHLLPQATTSTTAADTVGLYQPAGGGAEIGGDWFDVIHLPSLRVALVVGDVIGHGLHATATMGRLRTAVQTLADLDLDPTELLTHLDGLVQRLATETTDAQDSIGGTCLYAVYDPTSGRCTMASAGHPPPVCVQPGGTARLLGLSPGPPLGVGGMPFESATITLEPGSVLALYTDGLVQGVDIDIDTGTRRLVSSLAAHCRSGHSLNDAGRDVFSLLGDAPPRDDVTLLLARTRVLSTDDTAHWEFPADPAVVAKARGAIADRLSAWGLDDLAFTTELIVSELVTNAIRYAGGPVGLRLIREDRLICEVTDPSTTQPRLRRARWTDEGGRGLFLVAQLTTRWGSRYGRYGKTIWTEQPINRGTAT
ncbi:protein phosphatase [Streptomyces caeruleatus]|uniref:protein-serine/threonine phosphatase n=2 Tax=Streptomyces caeruleatus TaxID=661399 RepID=A0A101THQ3_9ACTN|nr:SpoIIE family protein phosphatase [Streptomyces caeruleatus]KUN92558.1 protein phosphatase [Streptomyces caeruleatus]